MLKSQPKASIFHFTEHIPKNNIFQDNRLSSLWMKRKKHFELFTYYIRVKYWDFQLYKLTFALVKDQIYYAIGPSLEKYPTTDMV